MERTENNKGSFERYNPREIEQKYRPVNPESLQQFREQSRPIEQFYLSSPSEPFSLRLREELNENGVFEYSATLKDRGVITQAGLDRLEVETKISPELYEYYKSPNLPCLKKLRTTINDHVAIDYYEDGHVQVESEHPNSWKQFCNYIQCDFIDITQDPSSNNELRANKNCLAYDEFQPSSPELHPDSIVLEILSQLNKHQASIVRIAGRSGSGKSTISRQIQQKLNGFAISSDTISTDDYHRGASWLRSYNDNQNWTEWDHPIVYDTETMAKDILKLREGQSIPKRIFSFNTQEPLINGDINPVPVLIIEGIYAHSPDFNGLNTLKYEVPTPLATCIGRRILRDTKERPQFADTSASLKYILEQAEPMYRRQLEFLD